MSARLSQRNVGLFSILGLLLVAGAQDVTRGGERTEAFDHDPDWEGRNHRGTAIPARKVRQDFGYSGTTQHAGGRAAGEIGGLITPAAEPAYYARPIEPASFRDRLTASGTLSCGHGPVHVLIGFFQTTSINEWRTPNTIALRIQGRGDRFYAFVEYTTAKWRAGADEPRPFARERNPRNGKQEPRGFAAGGAVHHWSLIYDPEAAEGRGAITASIDGETSVCALASGHKADGAAFNRFGVMTVSKSADTPGELWLDDLEIRGSREDFTTDPGWEGFNNHHEYKTTNIRPRFDFGFSPTHFAGGAAPGELGGLTFRGDIRDPNRMASYGDRLHSLSLDRPIRASGTIALRRGVTDSTTLLGFYHSTHSLATNPSQDSGLPEHFLGIAVEGPSREGFFVYPVYRSSGSDQRHAQGSNLPRIYPDGAVHRWSLDYIPPTSNTPATLTLLFDGERANLTLKPRIPLSEKFVDRFGLITTWIDGNGQSIYFDDLTYTASQTDRPR